VLSESGHQAPLPSQQKKIEDAENFAFRSLELLQFMNWLAVSAQSAQQTLKRVFEMLPHSLEAMLILLIVVAALVLRPLCRGDDRLVRPTVKFSSFRI
jgi:hypothetical protein